MDTILLTKYKYKKPYYTKNKSVYQIDIDLSNGLKGYDCFIDNNEIPEILFYKLNSSNVTGLCLLNCSTERIKKLGNLSKITHLIVNCYDNHSEIISTTKFENVEYLEIYGKIILDNVTAGKNLFPSNVSDTMTKLKYIKIRDFNIATSSKQTILKEIDSLNSPDTSDIGSKNDNVEKISCKYGSWKFPNITKPIISELFSGNGYKMTEFHRNCSSNDNSPTINHFTNCPNLQVINLLDYNFNFSNTNQILVECPNVKEIFFSSAVNIPVQNTYLIAPNVKIICEGKTDTETTSLINHFKTKFPYILVGDYTISDYINPLVYDVIRSGEFYLEGGYQNLEVDTETKKIKVADFDFLKYIVPTSETICHVKNVKVIDYNFFIDTWANTKIILHSGIDEIHTDVCFLYSLEFAEDFAGTIIYTGANIDSPFNALDTDFYNNMPNLPISINKLYGYFTLRCSLRQFTHLSSENCLIAEDEPTNIILHQDAKVICPNILLTSVEQSGTPIEFVYDSVDTGTAELDTFDLNITRKFICRCYQKIKVLIESNNFNAEVYNNYYNYLEMKCMSNSGTVEFKGEIPEKLESKYFSQTMIDNIDKIYYDLAEIKVLDDSFGKLNFKYDKFNNLIELSEFITEVGSTSTSTKYGNTYLTGITNLDYNNRFNNNIALTRLTSGGLEVGFNYDLKPFYPLINLKELVLSAQDLQTLTLNNLLISNYVDSSQTVIGGSLECVKLNDMTKLYGSCEGFSNLPHLKELDLMNCQKLNNGCKLLNGDSSLTNVWFNNTTSMIMSNTTTTNLNTNLTIHRNYFGDKYTQQYYKDTSGSTINNFKCDVLNTSVVREGYKDLLLKNGSYYRCYYDPEGILEYDIMPYILKCEILRLYTGAKNVNLFSFYKLEYLETKTLKEIVDRSDFLKEVDCHGDTNLTNLEIMTSTNFHINVDGCIKLKNLSLNVDVLNNFVIKSDYLESLDIKVANPLTYGNRCRVYVHSDSFGKKESDSIVINDNVEIYYSGPKSNFVKLKYKLTKLNLENNIHPYMLYCDDMETVYTTLPRTIPNDIKAVKLVGIKRIPANTFSGCNIEKINLENVEYIQDNAFKDCANLKIVNLSNVKAIGSHVFDGCELEKVIIGRNCEIINEYAFSKTNNMIIYSGKFTPEALGEVKNLHIKCFVSIDLIEQLKMYCENVFFTNKYLQYVDIIKQIVNKQEKYIPDTSDLFYYFNRFMQNISDSMSTTTKLSTYMYEDENGFLYTDKSNNPYNCEIKTNNLIWRNCYKYGSSYYRNKSIRTLKNLDKVRRVIAYIEGTSDVNDLLNSIPKKYLSIDIIYDKSRSDNITEGITTDFVMKKVLFNETSTKKYIGKINVWIYQNSIKYLNNSSNILTTIADVYTNEHEIQKPKCSVYYLKPPTYNTNGFTYSLINGAKTLCNEYYYYNRCSDSVAPFIPSTNLNTNATKLIMDNFSSGNYQNYDNGYVYDNTENLSTVIINSGPIDFDKIITLKENMFKNSVVIKNLEINSLKTIFGNEIFKSVDFGGLQIKLNGATLSGESIFNSADNVNLICKSENLPSNFASKSTNSSFDLQNLTTVSNSDFSETRNNTIILPDKITIDATNFCAKSSNIIIKNGKVIEFNGNTSFNTPDTLIFENCLQAKFASNKKITSDTDYTFNDNTNENGTNGIYFLNCRYANFYNQFTFHKDPLTETEKLYYNHDIYFNDLKHFDVKEVEPLAYVKNLQMPNVESIWYHEYKTDEHSPWFTFRDCFNSVIRIASADGGYNLNATFLGLHNSYIELLNHKISSDGKRCIFCEQRLFAFCKNCEIHLENIDYIRCPSCFDNVKNCNVYVKSSLRYEGSNFFGNTSMKQVGIVTFIYVDTNTTKNFYTYDIQ